MDPLTATSFLCGFQPPGLVLRPPVDQVQPQMAPLPGEPLLERTSQLPYSYATEHFVVRWGDDQDFRDGFEVTIGEDLETAWAHQVDDRGWERPPGSDVYKVDAFLGNTHPGGPTIDFDGAYVTLDTLQTYPYIVIAPSVVENYDYDPDGSASVLFHEFNHTLQLGAGLYEGARGAFWYEATANWMAVDTSGRDRDVSEWGSFLLHPEFAVYSFQSIDDDSNPARAFRQYSAAMFVRHISDTYGPELIRRSWDETDTDAQPLVWLDTEIPQGIRAEYHDFAVSHAVGDNPYARFYGRGADNAAYSAGQNSITAWLPDEGGSAAPPPASRPEAFGWNRLAWSVPYDTSVVFRYRPEDGTEGSAASFSSTAIVERQGGFDYHPFDTEVALDLQAGDFLSIVLTSAPESHRDREKFPYTYDFEVAEPQGSKGCGCESAPVAPGWQRLLWPVATRQRSLR